MNSNNKLIAVIALMGSDLGFNYLANMFLS